MGVKERDHVPKNMVTMTNFNTYVNVVNIHKHSKRYGGNTALQIKIYLEAKRLD